MHISAWLPAFASVLTRVRMCEQARSGWQWTLAKYNTYAVEYVYVYMYVYKRKSIFNFSCTMVVEVKLQAGIPL